MKVKLDDNKIYEVQCQQYKSGLYVVIYDMKGGLIDQFGLDITKEEFMRDLKKREVK